MSNTVIFTGTQVNYFYICHTKLWFFSNSFLMEHSSDIVALGKFINDIYYEREKKDQLVDNKIAIDFIKKGDKIEIHEIKKSNKMEKAHEMQLLYYLYYLKKKGITNTIGVINYPVLRRIKKVFLTEEYEREIEEALRKIKEIISMPIPPEPIRKPYCKRCAYYELCWSD
jgi:CRISPR-associated exonuclease Cas4